MEKRTPHYRLDVIKTEVLAREEKAFTYTAIRGGYEMGLTLQDMVRVVTGLNRSQFYKSMTTIHDNTIWQDVYHANTKMDMAYVKVTLRSDGAIVISFKRL